MTSSLLGNPHSASPSSQLSTSRIEDLRLRVLQFFKADPVEFDLIFAANATAGIKLVAEALRALPGGFDYAYHQASHTSLVGVRQEARNSICLDNSDVDGWVAGESPFCCASGRAPTVLFAYPAQSNMDGCRFPLSWSESLRHKEPPSARLYTLLDAAALVSTSPLDLSDPNLAPDFTVVSFYKIFGFPDLGALIVRRGAEPAFDSRRYFGGGTVDTVVCMKEQWHAPKTRFPHERLEDGTLAIHSIIALDAALEVHARLYGSMRDIAAHTAFLCRRLHDGLRHLCHWNGAPVCRIYSPHPGDGAQEPRTGPVVAFNLCNSLGAWVSLVEFEKLASLANIHIRTGGVCNPGGIADALGLEPWEMRSNFSAGFRCGTENDDLMAGKPTGVVRASLGAMSTVSDVDKLVAFIAEFYREDAPCVPEPTAAEPTPAPELRVASITVYPVKSCGGFSIPPGQRWEVRLEGLAWDREWCLLHRGSGQALSQKRHPRMALLRPALDFNRGQLRVSYAGELPAHIPSEVAIPLSADPAMLDSMAVSRSRSLQVCGEEISAQVYTSDEINSFFSSALDVPCVLARFPPGGQGNSMRHSKAHLQKHQGVVLPPSPPDSDSEHTRQRILLSNESPILAISLASLRALNEEIRNRGGKEVSPAVFRANVVLDSASQESTSRLDYAEDNWSSLQIGVQKFRMLGSCRRCHMVCINQETGEKSQEPFVTLAKTRRFDGKVFFGTHMAHEPSSQPLATKDAQFATIMVGDPVRIDV